MKLFIRILQENTMKPHACLAALIIILLFFTFASGQDEKNISPPSATITMEELRDHMFFLASDALGGRVWDQPGYELAVKYAASQFKAAGITPLLKDENGNPTFLQEVIIKRKSYSDKTKWTLKTPLATHEFKAGEGLRSSQPEQVIGKEIGNFYYVGYGISEPEHGWDDIKDLDLSEHTLVISMGTPKKEGKPVLPEEINKKYDGLGGLGKKLSALKKKGAIRMIVLCDAELQTYWNNIYDVLVSQSNSLSGKKRNGDNTLSVVMDLEIAKSIFQNQQYSPYSNPGDQLSGYKCFPLSGMSLSLEAEELEKNIITWNVVGVIPGKDPELQKEYVSLGAHLDHVPPVKGEVCNGADDNASGSVGVIEAGEALAMLENKRSILLCLWSAEEIGLFGSQYFVENPPVDLNQIKVHINLDMIARTDKTNEKNRAIYALGANSGSPAFAEFVKDVNTRTINWPLNMESSDFDDGGSDHQSFKDKGIPALFFFSGIHKDYHRPSDDPENLDWEKFLNVSRLACEIVDQLANTDTSLDIFRKVAENK